MVLSGLIATFLILASGLPTRGYTGVALITISPCGKHRSLFY
jgi:hypothetical protein